MRPTPARQGGLPERESEMRVIRSCGVLVVVCALLGASAAAGTEGPSKPVRETGSVARLVQNLTSFLKSVWDLEGYQIDPWGRPSQGNGAQQDPAPTTDEGYEIDPWG